MATETPATPVAMTWPELGGTSGAAWREDALARVRLMETLADVLAPTSPLPKHVASEVLGAIHQHLDAARTAACARTGPRDGLAGANVARVVSNVHAAEADLLRLGSDDYVRGQLPSIESVVRENLNTRDVRRIELEAVIGRLAAGTAPSAADRISIIATLGDAQAEARRKIGRVRSFRNVLFATAGVLAVGVIAVAVVGVTDPNAIAMCFHPGASVVCPTQQSPVPPGADLDSVIDATTSPWDLPLILGIGVLAGAIAAAAALRGIRGTSTPYSLPLALALLRLPTGALTAFMGLLLMRGEFIPGLSALDTPGQILAWAVVFGYAQELFTRLVDNQAHSVLDSVGYPVEPPGPPGG